MTITQAPNVRTGSISILVLTYNRQDDLMDFLRSLQMQKDLSALEEVLILNNASTVSYSAAEDFIKENPRLKINYIWSDENLGVSRGRNKLMNIAKGDWLLVLDDDIMFTGEYDLYKIAAIPGKEFFRNTNTAIFTVRVIYDETGEVQITAFPHKKYEKYKDRKQFLTSYFAGGAHIIKRDILKKTGLYPVDFFYGMEEYDLAYRVLDTGATIAYDNEVTLRHKESPYGRQASYQKLQMQWVNKCKMAWRYLPVVYFFTTAIMWSLQYLKNARGNLGLFFSGWGKIFLIPFREKRKRINKRTMDYLHRVEARLWY